MKAKKGVILAGLRLPMRVVLKSANEVWMHHGKELVVTSALDGVHSAASYHPFGYALDFRTRYFRTRLLKKDHAKIEKVARELRSRIAYNVGPLEAAKYVVVVEKSHIHVQYNAVT